MNRKPVSWKEFRVREEMIRDDGVLAWTLKCITVLVILTEPGTTFFSSASGKENDFFWYRVTNFTWS